MSNEETFKISKEHLTQVSELMRQALTDGVFPGAVLLGARRGQVVYREAFGSKSLTVEKDSANKMSATTVFDLGELTTVIVTTTLLMKIIECGKASLDDRVSRYIQAFSVLGKSSITLADLAKHSSGLPSNQAFYEELRAAHSGARRGILTSKGARDYIINSINRMELRHAPGSKQVYSDIGFILLGYLVELLTGFSLDRSAQKHIFSPLGLKSTSFVDLSMMKRRGIHPVTDLIAPTENCPWRKKVLCGEVSDDNAWVMGGIAGHSGLFSNINDVHVFANEILATWKGKSGFLQYETLRAFWTKPAEFPDGLYLGWDSPRQENGMLETGLSPQATGLNSVTGCSLWIEPDEGLEIILLSNRIHPSRSNKKIFLFLPELISCMLRCLRGK